MQPGQDLTRRQAILRGGLFVGASLAVTGCAALSPYPLPDPKRPGIHHVSLRVADLDRSVRFYTRGLGCKEVYRWTNAASSDPGKGLAFNHPSVFLDTGDGSMIRLIQVEVEVEVEIEGGAAAPLTGALHHFSFRVQDTAKRYQQAIAAGAGTVTIEMDGGAWDGSPLTMNLDGDPPAAATIAALRGPDGEMIELFQSTAFVRPGEPGGDYARPEYDAQSPGRL